MQPIDFRSPKAKLSKSLLSTQIIDPRGPRLKIEPLFDRLYVSSPDKGAEESGKLGGVHIPQTASQQMNAYAIVEVEGVGPDVRWIKKGDNVLVVRSQVNQVAHDGNRYFWTAEQAVLGVVR